MSLNLDSHDGWDDGLRLSAFGQFETFGGDEKRSRKGTVANTGDNPLVGIVWLHFHLSTRGSVMDRREFIGSVAFGLLVVPLPSLAQQVSKVLCFSLGSLVTWQAR